MKLQGLAIIFVIIILPITIIIGEYARVQMQTFKLEQLYDTRLITATDDALDAFQINTFNDATSDIADSKIESIEASANAFLNSMESNFGLDGYSKEELLNYVPALVYTMYDGYYIYSPYTNVANSDGTVKLDGNEIDYGFKPYVYYSCRYVRGNIDVIINYSLDNYITVQGTIDGNGVYESGYLVTIDESAYGDGKGVWIHERANGTIECHYNGIEICAEIERLADNLIDIDGEGKAYKKAYKYIKLNGTKYYWDETAKEIFYLMGGNRIKQVTENTNKDLYDAYVSQIRTNTSAISYYKDAYEFSNWVADNLGTLTLEDAQDGVQLSGNKTDKIFENIKWGPGEKTFIEYASSNFNLHRREVIRYSIESNLSVAIANFNNYTQSGTNFQMPKLKDNEWEVLENEVSIISFLQGLNIGGKIYNGYSVVANSKTEEVVKEDNIYLTTTGTTTGDESDGYYHQINDSHLQEDEYAGRVDKGVLNLDFEIRKDGATGIAYTQKESIGCYTSIVGQNDVVTGYDSPYEYLENSEVEENVKRIYYTALARERWGTYKIENPTRIDNILSDQMVPSEDYSEIVKITNIEMEPAEGQWSKNGIKIIVTAETYDSSVMDKVLYTTESTGTWYEFTNIEIDGNIIRAEGEWTGQYNEVELSIKAKDNKANESKEKKVILRNDSDKPEITDIESINGAITVKAEDNCSGIEKIEYSFDKTNWDSTNWTDTTVDGKETTMRGQWNPYVHNNKTLYVRAVDYAGNQSEIKETQIKAPENLRVVIILDGKPYTGEDIKVGLRLGGDDKGYVSTCDISHVYGTSWEIYGVQIKDEYVEEGVVWINYSDRGILGENNSATVRLYTMTFESNNPEYGTVSRDSAVVLEGTRVTISRQKEFVIGDDTGRKIIATPKESDELNTNIILSRWDMPYNAAEVNIALDKNITALFEKYSIVTDGIIRNYEANENCFGTSSNIVDLTGNSTTILVEGETQIQDECIVLNGTDSWINLGQVTQDYSNTNKITLEATVKVNEFKSGEVVIIGNYDAGGAGISIYDGKRVEFQLFIEGNKENWYSKAIYTFEEGLDTDHIYKFTATYNGTEMKLYIDGECKATTSVSGTIKAPENDTVMAIGANPTGNSVHTGVSAAYANINVYSAKVYNTALTADSVASNGRSIDGLIRDYSITRTWEDLAGNFDGIMAGGILVKNKYLQFDATDDWINIGHINSNQTGNNRITNQITMEASIKLDSIQQGEVVVMANYETGGVGISIFDGYIAFQVRS